MRTPIFVLVVLGLLADSASPGRAVTREDLGACNTDVEPRDRIAPCTAILVRAGVRPIVRKVAFHYRGHAFEKLGQYARAAQDYTQAIRIDPTDPDLYVSRGLIYVKLGRLTEANADAVKAHQLLDKEPNPDDGTMVGLVLLIEELRKRGVPGKAPPRAGAPAEPPRAEPPRAELPPAGTPVRFTWRLRNNTGETIHVKLFGPGRSHVWPGVGRNWRLDAGARLEQRITCLQGEKICYGAWYRRDPDTFWGVGLDGDQSCRGCCTTCTADSVSPDFNLGR
jgi:tetratricopeptide (TPR) repeat protein